jgi:sugar/nucleoside kinase (ribokinase family)
MATVVAQVSKLAQTVCLTRSAKGCIVLEAGRATEVPAASVKAVDTNGAGDMFAGAFLYAATQGHPHAQAAWLANQAAGQVVSQYGNRLTQHAMADIAARYAAHRAA